MYHVVEVVAVPAVAVEYHSSYQPPKSHHHRGGGGGGIIIIIIILRMVQLPLPIATVTVVLPMVVTKVVITYRSFCCVCSGLYYYYSLSLRI